MASLQDLQRLGWFITQIGMEECIEEGRNSVDAITKVALDLDLKEIGDKRLPEGAARNKNDFLEGPLVVQIQKLRNVSSPRENPESHGAPPLIKLTLTDGHSSFGALEMEKINKLTLNTPPGVKLRLTGRIQISTGFLMLNKRNCEVLGGRVEKLVENWQLKKSLANQTRFNVDSGGSGPPPFIPFGQRHRAQQGSKKDNFKSLEQNKDKENIKKEEDKEFEEQRRAQIKAVLETKEENRGKYFGSGNIVKTNDRDVAKIVDMGFTADQAVAALKQNGNNVPGAITALLKDKEASDPSDRDRRAPRTRQGDRTERNEQNFENERMDRGERGRGRRGGREAEEDDDYRKGPSAPATVFDFLATRLGDSVSEKAERENGKERPTKETSRTYSSSSESGDKRGTAGPPNLPPRLVKQQRAREEERIRRLSGGTSGGNRSSNTSSPGLQRAPPAPPYATQSTNRPPRPHMAQGGAGGRYHDQGPRGPSMGLRHPYASRPPYPGGRHPRMDYPPPSKNRVFDPHSRGQPTQNRMLWNEGEGGRRPYRDNRNNYDHRFVDRDYTQGPPSQRRGGPNQRYDNSNYNQSYPPPSRQGGRDSANQYSNPRGQYSGPPHQQPHGGPIKYNNNDQVPAGKSYKNTRPQTQHVTEADTNIEEPADELEVDATDEQTPAPSSVDPDSGGTQESESSVSDVAAEETVSAEQAVAVEAAPGHGPVEQDGYGTGQVAGDSQYAQEQVVQYETDTAMVGEQGATYVYEGASMSTPHGYVQMAPQAMIPQMQALNISGQPVSGAPMQTYQPYPGVPMEQMYSVPPQVYNPQPVPSLEYSNSSMGVTVVSSASNMVNGSKQKNSNDSLKQNARQWKAGDYCVAKYWEDQKFYRAIVNQVDMTGQYCWVLFYDYGNTEQVIISDIRPVPRSAWDANTIQSGGAMPVAPAGVVAVSQTAMPMSPPGILIQNPPAISFVPAPYQDPAYQAGSMVSLPPGSVAYQSMATTGASQLQYSAKPMQQHVYVTPHMTSQLQPMVSQPQIVTSQTVVKKT